MSTPAVLSDASSSSLSPPPSTLSSPSPPPSSSLSPPPATSPSPPPASSRGKANNGIRKSKPSAKQKTSTKPPSKTKTAPGPTKITIKLKQPKDPKEKKPLAKPREPKIEPVPRSVVNNHDVPLVVLFRSKFRSLFNGTSELGPQDVEEGVSVEGDISGKLEEFVCRICTLIGNRKKPVERDQLEKALQETVDTSFEKFGFRREGLNVSPFLNVTFTTMDWDDRLHLLKALVHWALLSSDAVRQIIDDGYKVPPHVRADRDELDINSGLGVLPLHKIKGDNYYLVEGRDTRFRIYHETNPHHKIINITSVAHDKPSLVEFAEKLSTGSKSEQELAGVIRDTIIARIEAAEQRRLKAEQAALRLAMWKAAAPVYNTRTRGKRVDYSEFGKDSESDEEEGRRGRRSERNRGERETVEYTASGRMVKRPRLNGVELQEPKRKEESEPDESEEEMEWSVYSDKGETEEEEDGEEGEDEEYDIGGRSLVVKFKIPKEQLKNATRREPPTPVYGKDSSTTTPIKPQTHSLQSPILMAKPYQPLPNHAVNVPYYSPMQTVGPVPYAGGASPPIPPRPVQLAPQPIQRPLTHVSHPQGLLQPQSYPQPQIPPQPYHPSQAQSFRQASYSMAQFPPLTASTTPSILAGPHTQPSVNGVSHPTAPLSPSVIEVRPPPQIGAGWSPPRPFGTAPPGQEIRVYSIPSASVPATNTSSQHQIPIPPSNKQSISPQQTWSATTFEPSISVNRSADERAGVVSGLTKKMSEQSVSFASKELNTPTEERNAGAVSEEIMYDSVKGGST